MKIIADIKAAKEALQAALALADGAPVKVKIEGTVRLTASVAGEAFAAEIQINEEKTT